MITDYSVASSPTGISATALTRANLWAHAKRDLKRFEFRGRISRERESPEAITVTLIRGSLNLLEIIRETVEIVLKRGVIKEVKL